VRLSPHLGDSARSMPMKFQALAAAIALQLAGAQDPAGSWLSYARFDADADGIITSLNCSWVVPSLPKTPRGSNAPGWWFGVQTKRGDGALIQPILAYGYMGDQYTMFNGVFDWTDASWHTSPEKATVRPGDVLTASIVYDQPGGYHRRPAYTMVISSAQTRRSISTTYTLNPRQKGAEQTAYFVLEHQPDSCAAYPPDGAVTFHNISVAVDHKLVEAPKWRALDERPACHSKATVVDPATIQISWDTSSSGASVEAPHANAGRTPPKKWTSRAAAEETAVGSLYSESHSYGTSACALPCSSGCPDGCKCSGFICVKDDSD
jgi:hypothetical protein